MTIHAHGFIYDNPVTGDSVDPPVRVVMFAEECARSHPGHLPGDPVFVHAFSGETWMIAVGEAFPVLPGMDRWS